MKNYFRMIIIITFLAIMLTGSINVLAQHSMQTVRYAVLPFQDTLLPIIGAKKGWYEEEGLDVKLIHFDYYDAVIEAMAAGDLDVAMMGVPNIARTTERYPEQVFAYPLWIFYKGFALMAHPNTMKTYEEYLSELGDSEKALIATSKQLKGKTVITTGDSGFELAVFLAAKAGGLDYKKDINIIDMGPNEGMAAFLTGRGDAYLGGIPQRWRLVQEGKEMILDSGNLPPGAQPADGLSMRKQFWNESPEAVLKLLRVWFRIIKYCETNPDDAFAIVTNELNKRTGAQMSVEDAKTIFNNLEYFPSTPKEWHQWFFAVDGKVNWIDRLDALNNYYYQEKNILQSEVNATLFQYAFEVQKAYVEKYGWE